MKVELPPQAYVGFHADHDDVRVWVTIEDHAFAPRPDQYDAIIEAFQKAKDAHHALRVQRWRDEFPEEPTPIIGGGRCESCNGLFEVLFLARRDTEDFEVCGDCAFVPRERARLLAPDAVDDFDLRAEEHDDGLDAA